ncbi:right-handed parallel beta-helix repeat-containing protein [Methanobacterium sp.]|uniref:right-handed parallel beta-helix repeat-containing protein n=1 Tax=Methanobacterium sp. TaxID=2164 RepID=UPI0025DF8CFF|nr:right-handed parallel beta-helix repeat-containing protein [Methanobacterium sp.]MBI5459620.1 right-handed parallel beta-helix repeat-containing protein [Methanobacterium sp.]
MRKVLLLIILSGLVFFLSISNASAASPANFTTDEIASASVTVKNQIETTKTLPRSVNIGSGTVNTAQYLHLAVQATNQINNNNKTPISMQGDTAPGYQEEQLNSGSMTKADYLDFARRIDAHMDDNHQAPPYGLIGPGKISYSSQVYLYSRILTIYKNYGSIPPNINLKAWSAQNIPITETQSFSFTPNQIVTTADGLKNTIESTKSLPNTVTVAGVNINTAQFLHLAVQATIQINNNNAARIAIQSDSIPGSQEEQLNIGTMTKANYLDFAQRINSHMNSNHQAPPYGLIGPGKISYSSQVYLYSRILSVYKTYGSLPLAINVKPWTAANIPIGYTTFTVAQITAASVNLKTHIETNKNLPTSVVVGGKTINTGQFLHLVVQATNQIKNNNNSTILLEDDTAPSSSEESLSSGSLSLAAYIDFAQRIDSYMDSNHQAPPYGLIGLGKISYQNMVYTFSKILNSYHTHQVLPSAVNVKPWVEVINPVKNSRTAKRFSTIQAAINDATTLNGDSLILRDSIYTENVLVNKKLTIKPDAGVKIIIRALNSSKPVFSMNYRGNGTTIQSFTITGATNSSGIYLTGTSGCNLLGNNIMGNSHGIYLYNSKNNLLSGNTVKNNTYSGIIFADSSYNTLKNNDASDNPRGIRFTNSNYNTIQNNQLLNIPNYAIGFERSNNNTLKSNVLMGNQYGMYIGITGSVTGSSNNNLIQNNTLIANQRGIYVHNSTGNSIIGNTLIENQYGVYVYYSSCTINFNRIVGNSKYGFYKVGNGTVNAINNWWGTNDPRNSSDYGSALYTPGGTVDSTSWLMLNLTGSTIYVTKNSISQSEITADLTHDNQGKDTSSSGTIPNGIPVNFTTTIGSINITITTKRGKAVAILTSNPSSSATTITSTLDNQTVSKAFRKSFNTIQAAISNTLTVDGDVILVENGTYIENIAVNKNLTIISDGNVTVQAANPSNPVFTINIRGSGSLIKSFVISGAVNSFGLLLNGCSNCTITNNTVTNNYFGILTNTVKTKNNVIIFNIITSNQMIGLGTCNSDNCVIYENTITSNGYCGIELLDSNNNIVHTNLIMSNDGPGIFISNINNTLIQNNLIPGNIYGLYMKYCRNCTVYGNIITQGIVGMYVNSSIVNINFNRIASNNQYELISANGNVNATNNWWGSNDNPVNLDEIVFNGFVVYNPWLMLSIDPTSTVNSGGNASITADLTHNNLGQDTSSLGHVIKGIPITFSTSYGTILTPILTFNGQAVAILNMGTTASRTVTVNASLDSQTVSRQMFIAPGVATLHITSSALNSTTLQPISLTYTVPLNSSVTWLSVLWKNTHVFYGELQIIINGTVVSSRGYVNPVYNTWRNSYRGDVFRAIIYANNYILQYGNNQSMIPVSFWNDLTSLYSLTNTELQFVQNHRLEFVDNLTVNLVYPGMAGQNITVVDPETSTDVINLKFPGNNIHRTNQITYMNGIFVEPAGYEGVKSFAIATADVTTNIFTYWLNQNSTYPRGAMKAAYGTFLTALLVEYCHDQIADNFASEYNVTWSRTHPIAVSVGDDAYQTYLTLECDHGMGMTVVGKANNMKLFNYACSSVISPIEYEVMYNLLFSYQTNSVFTGPLSSVIVDLSNRYLIGIPLDVSEQNGYIIANAAGYTNEFMVVDPETGIVRDINMINGFCGAYCFHDLQTDLAIGYGLGLLGGDQIVGLCNMIQGIMNTKIEITINIKSALAAYNLDLIAAAAIIGAFGPDEAFAAAGLTSEQIAILQASNWYILSRIGNIMAPIGLGVSILQGTLQNEINQVWQHPVVEVKVNGRIVYTQIHGSSNIV